MNHLAHCFLSFGDEDVLLGNFIGDFVKGKEWQRYPAPVQTGILLHRAIDSFTDNHAATDQSVRRIRSLAGRYAPPLVDILYDHLLALHWDRYSDLSFDAFAEQTYVQLHNRASEMPPVLAERLPRMLDGRFLHGYTVREGLDWVLNRFSLRIPAKFDPIILSEAFFGDLEGFSEDFNAFFPDLIRESKHFLQQNK
jgi:acyl carrier protein phosphodiesterase